MRYVKIVAVIVWRWSDNIIEKEVEEICYVYDKMKNTEKLSNRRILAEDHDDKPNS